MEQLDTGITLPQYHIFQYCGKKSKWKSENISFVVRVVLVL
jgi:hypothetical protein